MGHEAHTINVIIKSAPSELPQLLREVWAFVDVGIPSAHLGERRLHADIGLEELGDLLVRIAEPTVRIDRAVGGNVDAGLAFFSMEIISNLPLPVPRSTSPTGLSYYVSKPSTTEVCRVEALAVVMAAKNGREADGGERNASIIKKQAASYVHEGKLRE